MRLSNTAFGLIGVLSRFSFGTYRHLNHTVAFKFVEWI